MKRELRNRILLSALCIALCVAAIVAVCVILFTGGDGGHIIIEEKPPEVQEGTLNLSLVREKLQTATLNERGLLVTKTDEKEKDFSKSDSNIFGIDGNVLIGPACWFQAEMAMSNKAGDPFEYWLEIVPVGGEALLADQLQLTVERDGEIVIQRTLLGGLETRVIERVEGEAVSRFTVRLEYLDVKENDETKNMTLVFDLTVHARLV